MNEIQAIRRELVEQTPGWLTAIEGECLYRHAVECVGPFVEIGSYCGKSTVWIGSAAEARGTHLLAIDSLAMASKDLRQPTDGRLWDTITKAGLKDVVVPINCRSEVAFKILSLRQYGFVFIDGSHVYSDVLMDYLTWAPDLCRNDGMLAFHDSEEPGPKKVVAQAIKDGWKVVEIAETVTVLVS